MGSEQEFFRENGIGVALVKFSRKNEVSSEIAVDCDSDFSVKHEKLFSTS